MTERELQAAVIECARLLGWRVYHTYDSRRSEPGFPDLFMVNGPSGMAPIAAELKTEKGKVTDAQRAWLDELHDCGVYACVWRPAHWRSGHIERVLRLWDTPSPPELLPSAEGGA